MCRRKNCILIQIVEIQEEEKLYVHYDKDFNPIWIQYYNSKNDKELTFAPEYAVQTLRCNT